MQAEHHTKIEFLNPMSNDSTYILLQEQHDPIFIYFNILRIQFFKLLKIPEDSLKTSIYKTRP